MFPADPQTRGRARPRRDAARRRCAIIREVLPAGIICATSPAMSAIRLLELQGTDPAKWGEQHGESFRDDIKAIAAIRMELTLSKTDLGTKENVLALAKHHLPLLEQFDAALFAE